jgi:hypothetical protein
MPGREYTAFLVLQFLTENRSDPNYPIGFTANFLASHVTGIKSQTWRRMQEIVLEPFEKKEYVQSIRDGTTRQTHYKITDRGVAAYMRWKPVIEEWIEQSYFGVVVPDTKPELTSPPKSPEPPIKVESKRSEVSVRE